MGCGQARATTNFSLTLKTVANPLKGPPLLSAFPVSDEPTKKAAATRALQEFIARREQRWVVELFGKLDWDAACDDKAERASKP